MGRKVVSAKPPPCFSSDEMTPGFGEFSRTINGTLTFRFLAAPPRSMKSLIRLKSFRRYPRVSNLARFHICSSTVLQARAKLRLCWPWRKRCSESTSIVREFWSSMQVTTEASKLSARKSRSLLSVKLQGTQMGVTCLKFKSSFLTKQTQ